jgi:hypothetical protein
VSLVHTGIFKIGPILIVLIVKNHSFEKLPKPFYWIQVRRIWWEISKIVSSIIHDQRNHFAIGILFLIDVGQAYEDVVNFFGPPLMEQKINNGATDLALLYTSDKVDGGIR